MARVALRSRAYRLLSTTTIKAPPPALGLASTALDDVRSRASTGEQAGPTCRIFQPAPEVGTVSDPLLSWVFSPAPLAKDRDEGPAAGGPPSLTSHKQDPAPKMCACCYRSVNIHGRRSQTTASKGVSFAAIAEALC